MAKYDRLAWVYGVLSFGDGWRKELLSDVRGKVLEIGVGSGANLPYYHPSCRVYGIDPSVKMLHKAKGIEASCKVYLKAGSAEDLPYEDGSFDVVVSTLVFCCVPDPVKGLKEARRVLKKDGYLLMVEHMRSERPWVRPVLDAMTFVGKPLLGEHFNRDTLANLRAAGFKDVMATNLSLGDIVRRIEAKK